MTVTDMALDGDAIARHEGYVLFVTGTMPGEEIEAEVEWVGRKHGRARLLEIVRSSEHRTRAPCPYFGDCGGCTWQHIEYGEQLAIKERLLRSTLGLALQRPVLVLPARGLEDPWGYRNKVHFAIGSDRNGRLFLGHSRSGSPDLVPVEECRVHAELGNRVAFSILELLRRERVPAALGDPPRTGVARHVLVRCAEGTDQAQAILVATCPGFPGVERIAQEVISLHGSGAGFHLSVNRREGSMVLGTTAKRLAGRGAIEEQIAGLKFRISPSSFFQTNVRSARNLVETVMEMVGEGDGSVLDLYAGVGLFALPLAKKGRRVLAVEENPHAVGDGIASAGMNGLSRARFIRSRAESWIGSLTHAGAFEVAILDPPREGAADPVLYSLAVQVRPKRIVYVSCDPRSLTRDLRRFSELGYDVVEVRPVDMFPHTSHIEAVALLVPGAAPSKATR